jgi:hypothetical protein
VQGGGCGQGSWAHLACTRRGNGAVSEEVEQGGGEGQRRQGGQRLGPCGVGHLTVTAQPPVRRPRKPLPQTRARATARDGMAHGTRERHEAGKGVGMTCPFLPWRLVAMSCW